MMTLTSLSKLSIPPILDTRLHKRIFYSPALTANLKVLSFTLVDRNRCNALYNAVGIGSIDQAALTLMKTYRSQALQAQKNEDSTSLPEIAIPTFTTTDNYDDFMSKFLTVVSHTKGFHGVSIDYIVREVDGNFDDFHATRKLKLQACLSCHFPKFNEDSQTLYGLYLQYIGTTGHGANIVKRFQQHKQGYQLHFAFIHHFANTTYLENKATQAESDMAKLNYSGDKPRFKLEDYYKRMTACFNDLANGRNQFTLKEHQKIAKFGHGLKNAQAVKYYVDAKLAWDSAPDPKNFDDFYNFFSSKLQQYRNLMGEGSQPDTRHIVNQDASRGRGRGGQFGRGSGREAHGRGRGRCRGGSYSPYTAPPGIPNFTAEARTYPQDLFHRMWKQQKAAVQQAKVDAGWKDGRTSPDGFVLNGYGYAIPSPSIISAVQSHIRQYNIRQFQQVQTPVSGTNGTIPLPPPPPASAPPAPPIPGTITTTNAGHAFGSSASRGGNNGTGGDVSVISMVNGRSITGHVYDASGIESLNFYASCY
jgi:hypothetical protein